MADMSPAAWLALLDKRLTDRWAAMRPLDDMFEGRHPLAFATSKWREAFGDLLATLNDNWCRIVVSASVQRLTVQGFRFGGEQNADKEAWAIWQDNGLDAEANLAHTEAVKLGESYWLVAPPDGSGAPRITSEHPSQMIVACAAGDRRVRRAALKRWLDDDGYIYATLYLPTALHKWRSQEKAKNGYMPSQVNWQRRTDDPGGANPLGVVPVVPLRNAPTMLRGGQSDFAPGIPIQQAIDKLAQDMMVAAEFAAYRQRVMTGVEQAKYPEGHAKAGQNVPMEMGISRLVTIEATDGKVFDLPASDLKNYTQAIDMLVQHFAAQTQTPPHYLLSSIVNASGEALVAAESGLVSKVQDKQLAFGDGHEEAMRLAFRALRDKKRATAMDAETLWADAERRSFAQVVDGVVKLKDVNVPDEILWEDLGWSPQKVARAKVMQATSALFEDGARTDTGGGAPGPAAPADAQAPPKAA